MASRLAQFLSFTSILGAFAQLSADCNSLAYQAAANPSEQFGYNVCNSTTDNQSSLCQTAFINSVDDFCLWGPANPVTDLPLNENEVQQVVAWCTKPGHGTRVIPPNTLAVSIFVKTPYYVEVLGWFDQHPINYPAVRSISDYPATQWPTVNITAQLDPQGSDGQGGPIGGLMFSNAFGHTNAKNWINIIGEGGFMIRACDPNIAGAEAYCTRWPGDTYWSWFEFFDPSAFPGHVTSVSPGHQSCTGPSILMGAYIAADKSTKQYTGGNPSGLIPVNPQVADCTAYNSQDIYPTKPATTSTQVCTPTPHAAAAGQSPSSSGQSSSLTQSSSHGQSSSSGQLLPLGQSFSLDGVSSPGQSSISGQSTFSSSTSNPSSSRVGAIVGAIVGVLALIALIAFLCIWRRRRSRRGVLLGSQTDIAMGPYMSERATPSRFSFGEIRKGPLPPPPPPVDTFHPTDESSNGTSILSPGSATGTSNLGDIQSSQTRSTIPRGTSTRATSSIVYGLPPSYSEVSDSPPSDGLESELALWAQDNRDLISLDLEDRLREAHYLPSDNPDEIPEDVWARDYGIRHFELKRLRELYAQREEVTSSIG